MSETVKIPTRNEVDPKYTWAITDLYPSDEAWKKDLQQLSNCTQKAPAYQGQLGSSAQTLLDFYKLQDEITLLVDRVYGYASRKSDEDTANSVYQAFLDQAFATYVKVLRAFSFSTPEILSIPEETIAAFYKELPELNVYARTIREIRRRKEHILSEEEEKLLASAGELSRTPDTISSMLNDADLTFPSIHDSKGNELEVTHGSFIPLMQNKDISVRKAAFESLYHTYEGFKNTSAALLSAQVKQLSFFARARKYPSNLCASLDETNVPVKVYHNLIEAVHTHIGSLHKYTRLRKKLLKTDELHMYDLYVPIVPEADVKVSFEEAKENVLKSVAPLGAAYQKTLSEGFEQGWIDVYENKGKRSGAYSAGHHVHPFVLLNYKDTLDSEFTLAHEMGHAMHSYLSNHTQAVCDAEYVIFVAEVASTCNESLLMQYLLNETADKQVRAYLINYFLEQFRTTLYRQTMFAEFELKMNEMAENGQTITADALCHLYHDLNVFYYGKNITVDKEIDIEWARIPHFYMNYYVFQYATGFSAAIALSQKILKEGESAVKDYLGFLSGGCSKDPISLLKGAGVDMTTASPVAQALELFDSLIDELEALLAD